MLQVQPLFRSRDRWEALARREHLAYEVLELSFPAVMDAPERCAPQVEWYAACGRVNAVHGAFIDLNPASRDPLIREASRMRCRQSCTLAKRLGANYLVFHGGAFPFLDEASYLDPWAADSAAFYEALAKEYDLHLCIENAQDIAPLPLRRMMEKVTDRRVSLCLDLGHANYSRAPLEEWFGQLGPWLGYLHLSDNRGLYDDHIPLGTGTVDWAAAHRLWRSLGREMPMTLEVGGIPEIEASLAFLRRNHYMETEGAACQVQQN